MEKMTQNLDILNELWGFGIDFTQQLACHVTYFSKLPKDANHRTV